jgi:hypothetical protein
MGLGEDTFGQNILDASERRNKIKEDLATLKTKLGIESEPGIG